MQYFSGYFIHLENYGDNKPLAKVGWSLFSDGTASVVHEASVLEAFFHDREGADVLCHLSRLPLAFLGQI